MYPIRLFLQNPTILWTTVAALTVNFAMWIAMALYLHPQQSGFFLHYTVWIGVDYVGKWWQPIALPLLGIIILVVNLIVAHAIFLKEKIIGYVLASGSIMIQLLLATAAVMVLLLNA